MIGPILGQPGKIPDFLAVDMQGSDSLDGVQSLVGLHNRVSDSRDRVCEMQSDISRDAPSLTGKREGVRPCAAMFSRNRAASEHLLASRKPRHEGADAPRDLDGRG